MKVNKYFGRVVSIDDPEKKLRCQIEINGKTDSLQDLPWYYPCYGLFSLPDVNDVVPVTIYDDCFTSGTYERPIANAASISDDDYPTYLEIYSKKSTKLSYSKSEGIVFLNGEGSITLKDKIDLFFGSSFISVTNNGIALNGEDHKAAYGDVMLETMKQTAALIQDLCKVFNPTFLASTWTPACSTPYTLPLIAPMSSIVSKMTALTTKAAMLKSGIDETTHLSETVKLK